MDKLEHYKLQLKSFESGVSFTWKSIQTENKFHDVTIACDKNEIQAHKVILSANSSVFKSILGRNNHPHPVIYLRGIKFKDLCHILDFIYQGEVSIEQNTIDEFLSAAEDLEIRGLTEDERKEATSVKRSEPPPTTNLSKVENLERKIISEKHPNEDINSWSSKNKDVELLEDEIEISAPYNESGNKGEVIATLTKNVEQKDTKLVIQHDLETRRKRTSFVWKYFDFVQATENILERTFVKCNICQRNIKYSGGTSNMIHHVKQHVIEESIAKLENEDALDPNRIDSTNEQKTVHQFLSGVEDYRQTGSTNNVEMQKSLDNFAINAINALEKKRYFKKSFVWKYFDFAQPSENILEKTFVECNICKKKIKHCGGTSSMITHVKQHNIFENVEKVDAEMDTDETDDMDNGFSRDSGLTSYIYHACDQCDYITLDKSSLDTHKQSIHVGFGFSCDKCDFETTQEDSLKEHKHFVHKNITDTNLKNEELSNLKYEGYPCDECDHVAESKISLKYHIGDAHRVFRFRCDTCPYATNNKSHLTEHNDMTHKKIRYPCDVCNYQALTLRFLKKHMIKVHNDNNIF